MEIARAREIVSAINNRCMVTIGLEEELKPLAGVSLEQMLLAKRMVETANRANQAAARISGGRYTVNIVPDDRLIAAAYVLDHYPVPTSQSCPCRTGNRAGAWLRSFRSQTNRQTPRSGLTNADAFRRRASLNHPDRLCHLRVHRDRRRRFHRPSAKGV